MSFRVAAFPALGVSGVKTAWTNFDFQCSRKRVLTFEFRAVVQFEAATLRFVPPERERPAVAVRKDIEVPFIAIAAGFTERTVNEVHNLYIAARKIKRIKASKLLGFRHCKFLGNNLVVGGSHIYGNIVE